MRAFLQRFRRALRTIPRRVRWVLTAPIVFIGLFLIDGQLAISVFFAVFAWLVVLELYRDRHHINGTDTDIHDGMINPATGLMMNGGSDIAGNSYGCGHHHDSS